jgi:uncharacterized repeat protein (TIGR03803 family)
VERNLPYAFTGGTDGSQPDGGLVIDKGNLYGTTWGGSVSTSLGGNGGVVFELSRNIDSTWSETVTHSFGGTDGADPRSTLVVDKAGKLYGTTVSGGTIGYGVVFEITPRACTTWRVLTVRWRVCLPLICSVEDLVPAC